MFCPECGKSLAEHQKFCSECGAKVSPTATVPTAQQTTNGSSDFSEYVDQYIRDHTTFTSVPALITGARPLRFALIITLVLSLIGLLMMGPGGIIIGLLVSLIVCRLVVLALLIKRTNIKYNTNGKTLDLDDLAVFLERNLDGKYFTAWQRGEPTFFGMTTPDRLVIECLFNNKTFHRITFDTSTNGVYMIEPRRATAKERLKDGGDRNPNVLYKSDWVVRPILEAALQYYFNTKE